MTHLLPDSTGIGSVALTVADLGRAEQFYVETLGFTERERGKGELVLGSASADLLRLTERPGAKPKPARATGLYHFAILVPNQPALGRSLLRLAEQRYPLDGASDHGVSEALYLSDPDGNGIEIYRDRPRSDWPRQNGQLAMVTDPLDLRALASTAIDSTWNGLEDGTIIGHVHLHVANLSKAQAFYTEVIGFDFMQYYPSAAFVSAGGYHHHLGINTWAGPSAPPPDAAGLRYYEVVLPDAEALAAVTQRIENAGLDFNAIEHGVRVQDPTGNTIHLITK